MINLQNCATFGVAGNFTGHLEQAGEDKDFKALKTASADEPKGMFPTYIPGGKSVPEYLKVFPFDSERINFPAGEQKLQIEPECCIVFKATWSGESITALSPVEFGASNDCSIRKEGASKISQKKNWGKCSKGASSNMLKLESFAPDGILSRYRICSFLARGQEVHAYGEDSAINDYSYIYSRLQDWMLQKLNGQKNEGPLEDIHSYLTDCGKPEYIMVSIGATRYTEFGEHNFLEPGDKAVVILYPQDKYSFNDILQMVRQGSFSAGDISVLVQTIQQA